MTIVNGCVWTDSAHESQDIAARYGIRSIPTLIVFKDGREVARQPGAMGLEALTRWVNAAVG